MHCQTLSFDIFLYTTISSGVTRNFSFAKVKFAATNIVDTLRHEKGISSANAATSENDSQVRADSKTKQEKGKVQRKYRTNERTTTRLKHLLVIRGRSPRVIRC